MMNHIFVNLPHNLHQRLVYAKKKKGIAMTAIVRLALDEWLQKNGDDEKAKKEITMH